MKRQDLIFPSTILSIVLLFHLGCTSQQNPSKMYSGIKETGILEIDQIREEITTIPTTEENISSRHAALRMWYRLFWRQGYDMSAFKAIDWVLINRIEKTPEMIQAIGEGYAILEDLQSYPIYVKEVQGVEVKDKTGTSKTNWPFYHGIDGAQTGYSPDIGPSLGKVVWRFPKPNQSRTLQPVLSQGRVYFANRNYCLNEETGERIEINEAERDLVLSDMTGVSAQMDGEQITLLDGKNRIWENEVGFELRGKPAIYSEKLYIGGSQGQLLALDILDGKVLWSHHADKKVEAAFQYYSTGTEYEGRLYIGGASSELYCLDPENGSLLWKYEVSDWIRSRPLVIGEVVYIATLDGNLYALRDEGDRATELKKEKVNEHGFTGDLQGSEKGILAAGRDHILYSISLDNLSINWKHGIRDGAWINDQFYSISLSGGPPSPTVVDGILYCGGSDHFVHAIDAESGMEIWRFEAGANLGAGITVAEGKVFFGIIRGEPRYHALDKNTGKLLWKSGEFGNVWVAAQYNSGKLFFGNMEGMMYAVDAANGRKIWSYDTSKDTKKQNWRNMNEGVRHGWPPGIYPVPVADETKVYIGSWSGYYFAFDQETGKMIWRTQTNGGNLNGGLPDSAAPVLWGDHMYVQKTGNILAALNRETGVIEWEWTAPKDFGQNGTIAAHDDKIFGSYFDGGRRFPIKATIIAFDDVANGSKELWRYEGGGGLTAPVITDGKLITGSSADPFLVCLNPDTGDIIWRLYIGGIMLEGVPAVYGDKVYVQVDTEWIYAIK